MLINYLTSTLLYRKKSLILGLLYKGGFKLYKPQVIYSEFDSLSGRSHVDIEESHVIVQVKSYTLHIYSWPARLAATQ